MMRWNLRQVGGLVGTVAFASLLVGCPSSGVGDPCIPEDEYKENFPGFKLTEENIESRSFQCQSRICLVNHFQGRASCPNGQPAPQPCHQGQSCPSGEVCTDATILDIACTDDSQCPVTGVFTCKVPDDPNQNEARCVERVCSKPQSELAEGELRCYVPGTDIPVTVPVCGQCSNQFRRDKDNAVYCSCRCGLAEGEDPDAPENANFNFCDCPKGYECREIRKNVGLGDKQISGKYCIKEGSAYEDNNKQCGTVTGYHTSFCKGTPSG